MNTDKYGPEEDQITEGQRPKTNDRLWLLSCILVTAIATFLRFFWLELRPFHHDEGVNGFFLTTLFREGVYKYDPANYHGPTLYYVTLAFTKVFGLETLPVRWSVAIFGVLTVVLAFFLKKYIGKIGSLFAALFLALSPGMVFISRYFIHEILFIFFTLAIVVSVLFFIEKRKAGIFAIGWTVLILLVCFLPSTLNLAAILGGENAAALWSFRAAFFIVESVLVFFVIRMLLAWDDGRPIYLLLASASTVLLFATKETAFITLGTMLIACGCIWIWRGLYPMAFVEKSKYWIIGVVHVLMLAALIIERSKVRESGEWLYNNFLGEGKPQENFVFYSIVFLLAASFIGWLMFLFNLRNENETTLFEPVDLTWSNFRKGLGSGTDLLLIIVAASVVFIYIGVLFFSSFFTYAEGVKGAFEAYAVWTKTGSKDHTQNGIYAYLKWGMKTEAPVLILSALGTLIALLKARHRFAMFTGLWAFGLFAAYTIIPYKTPWLALSFLLPMCIIAGYGINELITSKNFALKILAALLAVSSTSVLAYQTYEANFVRYDDEEISYVYAHTKREFLDLIRQIEYYADKSGRGKDATIEVVTPDYWPMPWYFTKYEHANFHGRFVDANTAEMIVAKKDEQDAEVIRKYSAHYKYVGEYRLRPGVDLMLLVRKDLADRDAKELYRIEEP